MSGKRRTLDTYGRFDEKLREYVIVEPLTPRPWVNYLSFGRMGAFISQGAGGPAWYKQPVSQRISRYRFLGLPEDRPGFYVYVREPDGTVWNPSFHPAQTPLDRWECRHGMGYTRFLAARGHLSAELTFFVPLDADVLVWDLRLSNAGRTPIPVFTTAFTEFSLFEYYKEILGWVVLRNQIRFLHDPAVNAVKYHYFVYEAPHTNPVFFSGSGEPCGFDCDRDAFVGPGRDESNPAAVEEARHRNSELPGGGIGIGAIGYRPTIAPGATTRIVWTTGAADDWAAADALARRFHDTAAADAALAAVKAHWGAILDTYQADVPDPDARATVNAWNPYGCFTTVLRDRDISPDLPGLRSGIRFRDATQNCMAICCLDPAVARGRLELLLSHQKADGSALDAFFPDSKETPSHGETRCDNTVWPPMSVHLYCAETGDLDFLRTTLPYFDGGQDTVYGHLMNGLRQIVRDSGDHGLPLLKGRDWDDHLALFGEEGAESVMTAQNWCYAGRRMAELSRAVGEEGDAAWIEEQIARYASALETAAWDGDWCRQVLYRGGRTPLGSRARRENKIYINTQAWAAISGAAPRERAIRAMDAMRAHLNTDRGIRFIIPPYTGIPEPENPLVSNGPGLGENGGIFIQANCWAIMAETFLGRGDRAWEYYRQVLPPVLADRIGVDRYMSEPYMFSSHLVAEPDPRRGMANLSWLTGSVNWMYIVLTQHILGIRPTLGGLRVSPCIPASWEGFAAVRRYRGAEYRISVRNARAGGTIRLTADGTPVAGTVLPVAPAGATVDVEAMV